MAYLASPPPSRYYRENFPNAFRVNNFTVAERRIGPVFLSNGLNWTLSCGSGYARRIRICFKNKRGSGSEIVLNTRNRAKNSSKTINYFLCILKIWYIYIVIIK